MDIIPTMLTQNHERIIKGFMGQTTAFDKRFIKSQVVIMGENNALNEARYIHAEFGKGFGHFTEGMTLKIISIMFMTPQLN